ncbi:unnamed protein product [Ceutorhynchus assimilis]|uniref:FLYWCH-type domain-containing protein n=1 Tax=Ceutorhynchus assimilis TaxID=467358 RepID=A0A9N9QM15_9CUCU|nr:unnamed protein product [Ceutorhynchus assimilis]
MEETEQYLEKRIKQHKYDCRNERQYTEDKTALAKHHFENGHKFRFGDVRIVDAEINGYERKLSEMIHISMRDTVNIKNDTDGLSSVYRIIYVVAGVKNPKLIVDDYEYLINRKDHASRKTMWLCSQYHKIKCKSRIITYGKTVKINSSHNHPPKVPDKTHAIPQSVTILRNI